MTAHPSETGTAVAHSTSIVNGIRMHYWRTGAGSQAVVCLHGFPQTSQAWRRLAAHLDGDFTVIVPDVRGAGESERPASGYDKKTMAADIHALVRLLGFQHVHLVGHDIGAAIAYAHAAQWPDEVKSLVMIEMLLPGFGLESMYAIRKLGEFAWMPFFMAQDLPEWLLAGREAPFLDWFIRNQVVDQSAFPPEDISRNVQAYARPGALRAAFDLYRSFWQDAEDNQRLARTRLTMPVLAIGAEMSLGTALAKSLVPLTRDVRGLVIDGCGHFVLDEQPARLARALEAFFGDMGRS